MDERFSITSCAHCGQRIEFPIDGLGLEVQCPGCGGETLLTGNPLEKQESAEEEITAGELQAALTGVLPRRRISIFYQIGLLLVAIFMVLLPLVYLTFALLTGYGVYWYAIHGWVIFSSFAGGIHVMILKMILYLGPLLGGTVAVFFMFKPILARSPKRAMPLELNPAQHPRLYQFIAHLADLVGVSMPKRIYLNCDLNASVGFRRGFLSLLGNDLALNLGLVLVAGMNTRQFAAVVAHELGHCTQWLAMRLGYIIDRIDGWFVRVVYERDTWDEALKDWSNSVNDLRLSLIVGCVHLAVWLSRKILYVLMITGHAVSCFLSRQMEYHADSCAIAAAGSEGVESSLLRLREQSLLRQIGYNALDQIWEKRRQLPDSLPEFLNRLEKGLPSDFREDAQATLLNETPGIFATHPTPAQRIQKARRASEAGVFTIEKSASALFRDFAETSRVVTARHYRQTLGLAVTDSMLKPADAFFQKPVSTAVEDSTPSEVPTGPTPTLRIRRSSQTV